MYYKISFAIKILVEFCIRYFDGQTFFSILVVDSVADSATLIKAIGFPSCSVDHSWGMPEAESTNKINNLG